MLVSRYWMPGLTACGCEGTAREDARPTAGEAGLKFRVSDFGLRVNRGTASTLHRWRSFRTGTRSPHPPTLELWRGKPAFVGLRRGKPNQAKSR